MTELPWREAIIRVLEEHGEPMHYTDIAQTIIDNDYRYNVGATPATTVASTLSESMGSRSRIFARVDRGVYGLRKLIQVADSESEVDGVGTSLDDPTGEEMGLINAFGMFWRRTAVDWTRSRPRLLGVQQSGSQSVDFVDQAGVYVLYDDGRPIYVGRVSEPRMGVRLFEHTRDRLNGRWNRFSWFGVRGVNDDGTLGPTPADSIAVPTLIATMEALLIEGLEPPQNRRQGDGFKAVEFIQADDPDMDRQRRRRWLQELGDDL